MSVQPDMNRLDTCGPPDDVETSQDVEFEDSESLVPNPALEDVIAQEVRP